MVATNTYSFPITWHSEVDVVSQTGLALAGYHLLNVDQYLSYTAQITTTSVSGATIILEPLGGGTSIVFVQFSVVMTSSCAAGNFDLFEHGTKTLS